MTRISRPTTIAVAVALVVGLAVLLVSLLRGSTYQGRVSLLAEPVNQPTSQTAPQYGEVVSLTLPAVVELARSPSVLRSVAPGSGYTPDELGAEVSVELVPASGLARLSVRTGTAEQAATTASALGQAMVDADLLAPVGRLRLLDPRPEVITVDPDVPLAAGLALVAAIAAGLAVLVSRRLVPERLRAGTGFVRRSLGAAGVRRPVAVLRGADPATADQLAVLGRVAGRPLRVVPVAPELAEAAAKLEAGLPEEQTGEGASVALVADRQRCDQLTASAGLLPADAILVAVVLA
ncbi:hypothetical protein [Amycolatopsis sp. PS_44_ISF1]|uniref:hypothetical protein n=1 Tax=Amycolatopsis sp. PS_44_ISF1 TaxID=2974917 RepID=UPI0028DFC4A8|nr:hypothetical protein [Amycolatopsis sp. PS_44_ISF1]MDT8910145.1 hypothetical protein [Amycolatopsis sp. PS_44_ISF1]